MLISGNRSMLIWLTVRTVPARQADGMSTNKRPTTNWPKMVRGLPQMCLIMVVILSLSPVEDPAVLAADSEDGRRGGIRAVLSSLWPMHRIYSPPLPQAGEGRSRSALRKSENTGCRKAAGWGGQRGFPLTSLLSPWGEEGVIYVHP